MIVLAGDIGGTHARLALAEVEGTAVRVTREHRYPSREYDGLAPIVRQFLREAGERPARACFGVACQREHDECRAANLPWTIRVAELGAAIGIPGAAVINDFSAAGYGIACLGPSDLVTLQEGTHDPTGPIALIGPGTGLGEGFLLWDGTRHRVHASEGGHASFAPRDERQSGLAAYLRRRYGHASSERVISGPGLADIYRYLASLDPAAEQPAVRDAMAHGDPAAVVSEHALAGSDALCSSALDLFVEALASAAGDLALTVVASGGLYLAGGIAPRVVERLRGERFLRAFRDKGRKAAFLDTVPVRVVVNPDVGLLGAAAAAGETGT